MSKMLSDFIKSHREGQSCMVSSRVKCKDGWNASVQASSGHYCSPRKDNPAKGWTKFEVGFPAKGRKSVSPPIPAEVQQGQRRGLWLGSWPCYRAANQTPRRSDMTSPYLDRPLRSLEQARKDIEMSPCHSCGRPYDDSFADWTICRSCKQQQMEKYHGEPVYMDALGICWTQAELDEAGGQAEVDQLASNTRE